MAAPTEAIATHTEPPSGPDVILTQLNDMVAEVDSAGHLRRAVNADGCSTRLIGDDGRELSVEVCPLRPEGSPPSADGCAFVQFDKESGAVRSVFAIPVPPPLAAPGGPPISPFAFVDGHVLLADAGPGPANLNTRSGDVTVFPPPATCAGFTAESIEPSTWTATYSCEAASALSMPQAFALDLRSGTSTTPTDPGDLTASPGFNDVGWGSAGAVDDGSIIVNGPDGQPRQIPVARVIAAAGLPPDVTVLGVTPEAGSIWVQLVDRAVFSIMPPETRPAALVRVDAASLQPVHSWSTVASSSYRNHLPRGLRIVAGPTGTVILISPDGAFVLPF